MGFKVNDTVEWTSSAAGTTKTKRGKVVFVIPACRSPREELPAGSFGGYKRMYDSLWARDHESYMVAAPTKSGRGRPRLYWPRVSALRLVEGTIKCSAPPSLTPAEYAATLLELGLTAESATQPTQLELLVEFEMGRMSPDDYKAECEKYGYQF